MPGFISFTINWKLEWHFWGFFFFSREPISISVSDIFSPFGRVEQCWGTMRSVSAPCQTGPTDLQAATLVPAAEELSQPAFLRMDDGFMRNIRICSEIRILYLNQKGNPFNHLRHYSRLGEMGFGDSGSPTVRGDCPPLYASLLGVRGDILWSHARMLPTSISLKKKKKSTKDADNLIPCLWNPLENPEGGHRYGTQASGSALLFIL